MVLKRALPSARENTLSESLSILIKQEFYIIWRLQQIQNFSKIPLLEMLCVPEPMSLPINDLS